MISLLSIAEAREKCKTLIAKIPRDMLTIAVLVLASFASFGLGFLAGLDADLSAQAGQGGGLEIVASTTEVGASTEGGVVASKNGTKYYLPSCAGAEKISAANKVWFVSTSAARAAGYTPAANCKGL